MDSYELKIKQYEKRMMVLENKKDNYDIHKYNRMMKLYKQEIEKLLEKKRISELIKNSNINEEERNKIIKQNITKEKKVEVNNEIKEKEQKEINEYRDGRIYYNKKFIENNNISKSFYERYTLAKKYCKNKIVLDCACGCGYGSYILSDKAKYVFGYDISEDAINFARSNWQKLNISFNIFDMCKNILPLKYDVIVSCGSIEHFNMPMKNIIKKFKKQLKDKGILFLQYPENEDINPVDKCGMGRSNHYHGNLTNNNMKKILEKLNFKIIKQKFQYNPKNYPNNKEVDENIIIGELNE